MQDKLDSRGVEHCRVLSDQMLRQEKHNIDIVNQVLPTLDVPYDGSIVEYGSWRGNVLNALNDMYGVYRVIGYDCDNWLSHRQIIKTDVRLLAGTAHRFPIALGWNDCDEWSESPATKMAAMNHALDNMVPGGIYIEHKKCPGFVLQHKHLNLVKETDHLYFFRYETK